MTRPLLVAILLIAAACGTDTAATPMVAEDGAVLPDTQTIDGVLVMRHDPAAFATAPQWRVADSAEVVFDGGEDPNLDLTYVYQPVVMPNGSLLAVNRVREGRVMHFPPDGSPGRMIAGSGEGPGEVVRPNDPIPFGDSVAVLDDGTGRVNWFSATGEWVGSETLWPVPLIGCYGVSGAFPDRRLLAVYRCLTHLEEIPTSGGRLPTVIITTKIDFTEVDTIATVPGIEMVWVQTRFGGKRRDEPMMARLPRSPDATMWGSGVATTTDAHGYVIERRTPDGTVNGRLEVAGPRRPVTEAMREFVIARELEQINGGGGERMVDSAESRRLAREVPFTDSLPAISALKSGTGDILWVMDGRGPTDSSWAATAFRENGEIVARLNGSGNEWPTRFLDGRILVRTTDDDGVVRFEVRRIVTGER